MEGQPGALQVRDAKASQLNWTASPAPINMAVAAIGSLAPSPQEPPLSLLELLDGFFGGAKTSSGCMGIAQRTDLTVARRPALFMSPAFHDGSCPHTVSTSGCSCAAVGRLTVRRIPR